MGTKSLESVQQAYADGIRLGGTTGTQLGCMNKVASLSEQYGGDLPAEIFASALNGAQWNDLSVACRALVEKFSILRVGHAFSTTQTCLEGDSTSYMAFDERFMQDTDVVHYDTTKSPLQFRIKEEPTKYVGIISLGVFSVTSNGIGEKDSLGDVEENDALQLMRVVRVKSDTYPYSRKEAVVYWRNGIASKYMSSSPSVYARAVLQVAEAEEKLASAMTQLKR